MRHLLMVMLFAVATTLPLLSQTRTQRQKEARYREEIAVIQKEIKAVEASGKDASSRLSLIATEIELREKLLSEINLQIDSVTEAIAVKEDGVQAMQEHYDDLLRHFNGVIKSAYRVRNSKNWMLSALSGSSPVAISRRIAMLRRLSESLRTSGIETRDARLRLEAEKDSLALMKTGLEAAREEKAREAGDLRQKRAEEEKLLESLKKDKAAYEASLRKKQSELAALEKEIEKAIRASSTARSTTSSRVTDNTADASLASSFERNKGKLPWPVRGTVCEKFGTHRDPVSGGTYNINGVELVTQPSAGVTAVFDGVVDRVLYMEKFQNLVIIRHGGYYTMYCKMGSVSVKEGDKVKTGQAIGTVGTAGGETRFHFEVWKGSSSGNHEALDPSLWLKR